MKLPTTINCFFLGHNFQSCLYISYTPPRTTYVCIKCGCIGKEELYVVKITNRELYARLKAADKEVKRWKNQHKK